MGFDVWDFSARSLLRPYGRLFWRRIILRHPLRFLAGLWEYQRHTRPMRSAELAPVRVSSWEGFEAGLAEGGWLAGMGFCQKPLVPPCPSGRFSHQCWFLTRPDGVEIPPACRVCQIREVAEAARAAGAAIYIMTSAVDVARDLLLPAIRNEVPSRVLLSVCAYSVPPLTLALTICGLRGMVQSYSEGDCRDFATWLQADEGTKPELTRLPVAARARLLGLLTRVATARRERDVAPPRSYAVNGNLYLPIP